MLKSPKIKKIRALEILDSRGNPTLKVEVHTKGGAIGFANVPSGASTGSHEALELRDEDKKRYQGRGVLKAAKIIEEKILPAIKGMSATDQQKIDCLMIEMDNTPNKSRLGSNSVLGISLACARAGAATLNLPLFRYLQEAYSFKKEKKMPNPMCNLINGGIHSDSGLDIQEFMVVPEGIKKSFAEKIRAVSEIYHSLGKILQEKGHTVAVGDEGGYASRLKNNQAALEFLELAVKKAGYKWGSEIMLGIDAAASEFYQKAKGLYRLKKEEKSLTAEELVRFYKKWSRKFPFSIIEDGLAEDDWKGWQLLNKELGKNIALIGDDFTVTNTIRLQEAIAQNACNAIL
ncbi:MAG: phosphopyruvate hydratase, partial [Candidatus Moranbacteria bacterium]|nr:phosphopyruvate hydratase [Candidatus Moranbacteria bacterium]